ncbi:GDYXXLXY domain-containing protein [Nocardioides campestrisoli]|uniref:GDYXXLXY domain-containing protein n=1 Tax=Nocardioides campestrisoli TaxID=2736757 RepID=UPI00163D50F6|nr:GDYXXLXY domain-containing protein [Nocardioides campestrisoli]
MNRYAVAAGVAAVQLALTGVAVAPQLSARLTGDTYLMRVAPVDPIDPFRGAYVVLDYPDLWPDEADRGEGEGRTIYVRLVEEDGLMVSSGWTRSRPEDGAYLACRDERWEIRCGIESWFVSQDEARRIEETLREDGTLAEVKIDGRGNAAVVGLLPPQR